MQRILIVDDAVFMRKMLANICTSNGYTICGEAENGTQAIEKYKELKPDLVTLDITMPDMNGIEALKQIISHDPHAKCIMCSAMGQKAMVMESIKAGAKDFIVKPFQDSTVIDTINRVLR